MRKPIQRSKTRLLFGKIYYTLVRYFHWYFGKVNFATQSATSELPHLVFAHQTPLLRQLKDVDMWLQHNKIINLRIAIKQLNGVVVLPGQILSFWRLIGKPSRSKGYVDGMVLYSGTFRAGVGGGLCQLSNLIYWLTLHSPLTVVERHRHSYDVFPDSNREQPFGSGATVFYNYGDLQILNTSDQPYQLALKITNTHLVGQWRTVQEPAKRYQVYQSKHWITHEPWGGYVRHNEIRRKVFNLHNQLTDDQYITENHAIMMYQPFLEQK